MHFAKKGLMVTLCLCLFAVIAMFFFGLFDNVTGLFGNYATIKVEGEEISINTSGLEPGAAAFYQINHEGKTIRFFLARDRAQTIHAALDACDVCWRDGKGYKLEDGVMVCVSCQMKFPLARIGLVTGGCNPHPVSFSEVDDNVVLSVAELVSGAHYFPENNK